MNKNQGKPQVLRNLFAKYQRCCSKNKTTMDRNYLRSIFVAYLVFVVSNFSQLTGGFHFELFCLCNFLIQNFILRAAAFYSFRYNANHIRYNEPYQYYFYLFTDRGFGWIELQFTITENLEQSRLKQLYFQIIVAKSILFVLMLTYLVLWRKHTCKISNISLQSLQFRGLPIYTCHLLF